MRARIYQPAKTAMRIGNLRDATGRERGRGRGGHQEKLRWAAEPTVFRGTQWRAERPIVA